MAVKYPNWFKEIAQYNFEEFLIPLTGVDNLQFLQLGAFTGDASVWLLDKILTGQGSQLCDVDTWAGAHNEPIQTEMDFDDVWNTYREKTQHFSNLKVVKNTTQDFLLAHTPVQTYDFIYVDAHHTSASAFLDSELSWPLLKQGGILAIDDYEWVHPDGLEIHAPKLGILMFLDRHSGEHQTLAINSQVWLKKL